MVVQFLCILFIILPSTGGDIFTQKYGELYFECHPVTIDSEVSAQKSDELPQYLPGEPVNIRILYSRTHTPQPAGKPSTDQDQPIEKPPGLDLPN